MSKSIISSVCLVLLGSVLCGCKMTPEQIKVVAQNAGLFSAVTWISYDNPDTNVIASVKSVLGVITEKSQNIEDGKTYFEVVYPEMVKVIDEKVAEKDRPLCKAASLTLLNGIDTLFAIHPEWKKDQDLALDIVKSFVAGAKKGLDLRADDVVMTQARNTASARAIIFEKEKKGWFSK